MNIKSFSKKYNYFIKSLEEKGLKLEKVSKLSQGINSQSYCVTINKVKRVLKFYPNKDIIDRDRLSNELNFLKYLNKHNIRNVPSPILWDKNKNWMLLSWLEGKQIKKIESEHINLLVKSILEIENLKYNPDSIYLNKASEAFFEINSHILCIKDRLSKVNFFLSNKNNYEKKNLIFFFNFSKYLEEEITKINLKFKNSSNHKEFKSTITLSKRTISQSDIGFHNIFITKDFKLQLFDFEYAGWDDSHKLISDLILQPDYQVPLDFLNELKPLISNFIKNEIDVERLLLLMEICRIKWLLIICNKLLIYEIKNINLDELADKLISYDNQSKLRIKTFKDFLKINYVGNRFIES